MSEHGEGSQWFDNCPKIETINVATVRQFVLVSTVLRSVRQKKILGAGAISSEKAQQRNDYKGSWKNFLRTASRLKIRLA